MKYFVARRRLLKFNENATTDDDDNDDEIFCDPNMNRCIHSGPVSEVDVVGKQCESEVVSFGFRQQNPSSGSINVGSFDFILSCIAPVHNTG